MNHTPFKDKWAASWQNQQNDMSAKRRLRSAWSFAHSDQSSLSAWRKLGSLATHWAHSEDSDQTRRVPRLICVFAGRTCHFVGFVTKRLKCLNSSQNESTRRDWVKSGLRDFWIWWGFANIAVIRWRWRLSFGFWKSSVLVAFGSVLWIRWIVACCLKLSAWLLYIWLAIPVIRGLLPDKVRTRISGSRYWHARLTWKRMQF